MLTVVIFAFVCVLLFGWMFYMMTCKPDVWLRLVKDERERKEEEHRRKMQRRAQMGKAVNVGAAIVAKILKK